MGEKVQIGLRGGGEWGTRRRQRTGVEGLLPLLHLGSRPPSRTAPHGLLPRHLRLHPRCQEPTHRPGPVPRGARRGGRDGEGRPSPASRCGSRTTYDAFTDVDPRHAPPAAPRTREKLERFFAAELARHRARQRRPRRLPAVPARARRPRPRTSSSPARATASRSGTASAGPRKNDELVADVREIRSRVSHAGLEMTDAHPRPGRRADRRRSTRAPGETAVDCTFGGGRPRARWSPDRIGPTGTLIAIDRDPVAEEHFAELAADVAVRRRASSARRFAEGLEQLRAEGVAADVVYMDLGMSLDAGRHARARLLLRLRRAARHADGPRPGADRRATSSTTWDERQLARALKELGEERYAEPDRARDRPPPAQGPIETTQELVDVVTDAIPAPARFAGGHPAKRTFQAVRIVVNDELGQLERALPYSLGHPPPERAICRDFVPFAGRPAREAVPRRPRDAAAPARRTSRCASAATSRRPSCSPRRHRPDARRRSPPTRARSRPGCAPHGSWRSTA